MSTLQSFHIQTDRQAAILDIIDRKISTVNFGKEYLTSDKIYIQNWENV